MVGGKCCDNTELVLSLLFFVRGIVVTWKIISGTVRIRVRGRRRRRRRLSAETVASGTPAFRS